MKLVAIAFLALASAAVFAAPVQDDVKVPDHQFIVPDDIKWGDAPPSLPPGAKAAVLEGNPAKPGPFTLRLKMPAGYKILPHTHPAIEHVTILSGTLNIGAGEAFDEAKTTAVGPGGYAIMQTGVKHFVWCKDEVVLQAHSVGPWGITYVNPADDPRNAKK
ncbi:MAG: cupin domain-containing protein [Planctomycetaceae bacterium]|nr:cupin domain-containing protein [Planctomycetaceae bacterium]